MFFTKEIYICNSPCRGPAKYLSCARDEFKSFLHLDPAPSPDICTVFFPVNSAGSPDFSLGSQDLAALLPPTCFSLSSYSSRVASYHFYTKIAYM